MKHLSKELGEYLVCCHIQDVTGNTCCSPRRGKRMSTYSKVGYALLFIMAVIIIALNCNY